MTVLRSLAFNVVYVLWTLFLAVFSLPVLLISREWTWRIVVFWARSVLRLLEIFCGITWELRGREHLTSKPVIYACKHQSAWDIIALVTLLPRPAFVLKRELVWIPLIGWYISRVGMVAINRSKGASALKRMLDECKQALHDRRPLVIYPEGTRSKPGAPPVYHPGVAALYSRLLVPVVPIALNSGHCWPRNAWIKKPGKITIEFLPVMPTELASREFLAQLQECVESACARLNAPVSG